MSFFKALKAFSLMVAFAGFFSLTADEKKQLPEKLLNIMQKPKYQHGKWGIYVKDISTGQALIDLNANQMFLPASTTKLFSVAALLNAYGDDYRFKTPVYALGKIEDSKLEGNLFVVAQGDPTMGGRQDGRDKIAYTKSDHIYANNIPRVILTKEDPLYGFNALAKQIRDKGVKVINGDVIIDDHLFQTTEKRGMILSPMMVNENLIDLLINPSEIGKTATLIWRPKVPSYSVVNELKTVTKGEPLVINISSDELGQNILVKGTIPLDQKDLVRTFSIKDPTHFARAAFIQALKEQEITINFPLEKIATQLPSKSSLHDLKPIAIWTSPPLSEYAKLILKVSHNVGADLIPLLLASRKSKATYDEGMRELGQFVMKDVGLSSDVFVFLDGAGGDENRLTPKGEVQLLEYMKKLPPGQFQNFYNGLPILGIDGSLADFAKNTAAVGKVRAKTGTGVSFNLATNEFFLTTQTLAGYIEGKNGHLLSFMISINNGTMPTIEDIFPIFEDLSQMPAIIYEQFP